MHSKKLFLILGLYCCLNTYALQDQTYGLGGVSTGRVTLAAEPSAFAALLNPALLAAADNKLFSFNLTRVIARIDNPDHVILDSRKYRTRLGVDRSGAANVPQVNTSLWSTGYSHSFKLPFWVNHRGGFGLAFSGPFDQFRRWVALSAYDFTPLRYGSADTQFKGTVSTAVELVPKRLFFGGGLSIFLTSAGIADISLTSENPSGRMAMDVAYNSAAVLGLYYVGDSLSVGLVARQSANPVFVQLVDGKAQVGAVDVMNQPVAVRASLYFEPAVLELEAQKNWASFVVSAGLTFQQWSKYEPRYLAVAAKDASGIMRTTSPPLTPMRDTLNPHASLEWRGWPSWKLSAGYQYRPTPVVSLTNEGNLMDSNVHVVGASVQRSLGNPLFFQNLSVNVYGQAHWMLPRDVKKTSSEFIGAPGYRIGGNALVFGAAVVSEL